MSYLGEDIKKLGFGLMRLPQKEGKIDIEQTKVMVDKFLEAISQFETSLKQTGAGYFDFYLLHNLGEGRTKFFDDFDMWNWILEMKEQGKIKHAGFSFHSTPEELDKILTDHPEMEFVQLQINYANWENPAIQSKACYNEYVDII